jgi:hypothetical protein
MRWLVLAVVFVLSGCDMLFPEFSGKPTDASVPGDGGVDDGGTSPLLAGVVCVLGDVRDYRTCASAATGILRITVEETRQQTMTDAAGHFSLPLAMKLDVATVAAVDPTSTFAPTIVPVRLANGIAGNIALPIISQQTLMSIELDNSVQDDPQLGTFIGWAIDPTGAPVSGVSSGITTALYDDNAPNGLSAGTATHQKGTVALFNVTPSTKTLTLTPPATTSLQADTFTLPIRSGAVTATTLVLPPR